MSKRGRSLGIAGVFLVGCAVGGGASQFVVPKASAQQAATLTKWEYLCFQRSSAAGVQPMAQSAGESGWELAAASTPGSYADPTWCFKRPKL